MKLMQMGKVVHEEFSVRSPATPRLGPTVVVTHPSGSVFSSVNVHTGASKQHGEPGRVRFESWDDTRLRIDRNSTSLSSRLLICERDSARCKVPSPDAQLAIFIQQLYLGQSPTFLTRRG